MKKKRQLTKTTKPEAPLVPRALLGAVRELILAARESVARVVDAGLTTLYWHVGTRIRSDILQE